MRGQLRQLTGDTAIYGVTTIVQRFLSFLLTPFYTHFLLAGEMGVQANIFAVVAFLLVVANAGMESAFFKFDSVAQDDSGRRTAFWNALGVNWGVAASLGLLVVLFPGIFNVITFIDLDERYLYLIRMAGAILMLDSMSMIPLALLRMRRKAFKFGTIKIATISVNVVLNVVLVGIYDMKLDGIFIAGVVQSFVQLALVMPFVKLMRPIRFSASLRSAMLRFGLPTLGSGLSLIALQIVDRPIIRSIAGFEVLGLYQANYRLGIIMVVFVAVFEFAWRPFFLQQAAQPNARALYSRIFTYFNLAAAGIFLITAFFIPNIAAFPLPFTDETFIDQTYWSGLGIVPIVMAAYILNGWYTNFIAGIYIEKKTSGLLWITGLGAGMEAILCFTLVPGMNIAGGAWATLGAYGVMAAALFFYVRRFYSVDYEWGRVVIILAGAGALFAVNLLLLDYGDTSLRAALIRLGLLAAFPVWLLATGFFSSSERSELKRILGQLGRRGR